MVRRLLLLASILSATARTYAVPVTRRSTHNSLFDGKHPLQGLEVNGLFNPIQSINPQLFERASEEHGNKLTTYRDICKTLPQDKLDSLMADHFATFVTDYDLESIKSAHVDTLRIPLSYNVFIPEQNRTDIFPKGELAALDRFIEHVLDYDMTVWLDLMATPNNRLGMLEQDGYTVTPDVVRRVVKHIAQKYDSRDVTTVLVHPDITFPSTPSNLVPLHPQSIRKTKDSQFSLYGELSTVLGKSGKLLAIDTVENLDTWARLASSFSHPVVLVHSLKTGIVTPRQRSISRIMTGIKEDIAHLKEISKILPIAVTWDASINSCIPGTQASHDCTLTGQLWHAVEKKPRRDDDAETLNDLTEKFGKDILKELHNADLAAWFFRTAKIQSSDNHNGNEYGVRHVKRRTSERIVSGNDFISLSENGIISRKALSPSARRNKKLLTPVVLGLGALGAAGAGALGWWCWDDIQKTANDVLTIFKNPTPTEPVVKKSEVLPLNIVKSEPKWKPIIPKIVLPPTESVSSNALSPINDWEIISSSEVDLPQSPPKVPITSVPEISSGHLEQQIPEHSPSALSVTPDEPEVELSFDIEPLEPYETDYRPDGARFNWADGRGPAWGLVDTSRLQPVDEMISQWQAEPVSDITSEGVVLDNDGSVAAKISAVESRRNSALLSSDSSGGPSGPFSEPSLSRGSGSKYGKGITKTEAKFIRPLKEIQHQLRDKDVIKMGPAKLEVPIPQARPRRGGDRDVGTKRYGKVVSVHEIELLENMRKEHQESSAEDGGSELRVESPESGVQQGRPSKATIAHDSPAKTEEMELMPVPKVTLHPEPLTHVEQELYTRPHAGTALGSPDITSSLAKLRQGKSKTRHRPLVDSAQSPPSGHHVLKSGNAVPMAVHPPRHRDMDPNHPINLKKMKPKSDTEGYVPYPSPDEKRTIKSHHLSTHKITSTPKGVLSRPNTLASHQRESKHIHPDTKAAFEHIGKKSPPIVPSGIGQDPRQKFEEVNWTEKEKKGNHAYVENVRNEGAKVNEGKGKKVSNMAQFWTEKDRMETPESQQSVKEMKRQSGGIQEKIKALASGSVEQDSGDGRSHSSGAISAYKHVSDQADRIQKDRSIRQPSASIDRQRHGLSPDHVAPTASPKLTHLTKDRVRPPKKNRLSGSSKDS